MKYFWATVRHKWFVLLASFKTGLPLWLAIVHDLSKFSSAELSHYNRQFFGDKSDPEGFALAWLHHQEYNDHHWGHYISSVGIVVSYNSAAEKYKFVGEKTSFGKIDAFRNPLKIIGIIESPAFTFGDNVIDGCIFARHQQIASDGTPIFLRFQFVQEHFPECDIVMFRCMSDDDSPMQKTIPIAVWQTFCSADYTTPSSFKSFTSCLTTFLIRFSLFLNTFRRHRSGSFSSHLDMESFQLLLPGCSNFIGMESHTIGFTLNRIIGSIKDVCKYFRSIGGVSLSENLLLFLCPRLCLSHNNPPNDDCTTEIQYCQKEKQYWILPGVKLLPMSDMAVLHMITDWMAVRRAQYGTWDNLKWKKALGLYDAKVHPETKKKVMSELERLGLGESRVC